MIIELGHFALVLALCAALAQSVLPVAGAARGNGRWMAVARPAARLQFGLVLLAFMALTLHLLPQFGFGSADSRLVLALPWTYGSGQLLHVAGLAFAGGHGAQRKTAVAQQGLEGVAQVAGMAVMGIGGLIAVSGGILFLVAFARALRARRAPAIPGTAEQAG